MLLFGLLVKHILAPVVVVTQARLSWFLVGYWFCHAHGRLYLFLVEVLYVVSSLAKQQPLKLSPACFWFYFVLLESFFLDILVGVAELLFTIRIRLFIGLCISFSKFQGLIQRIILNWELLKVFGRNFVFLWYSILGCCLRIDFGVIVFRKRILRFYCMRTLILKLLYTWLVSKLI